MGHGEAATADAPQPLPSARPGSLLLQPYTARAPLRPSPGGLGDHKCTLDYQNRHAHPSPIRRSHPFRNLGHRTPGSREQLSLPSREIERTRARRGRPHPNGRRRPWPPPAPPFSFTPSEAAGILRPGRTGRAACLPLLRPLHGLSRVLFLVALGFLLGLHPQRLQLAAANRSAASGRFRPVSRETASRPPPAARAFTPAQSGRDGAVSRRGRVRGSVSPHVLRFRLAQSRPEARDCSPERRFVLF